MFLGLLIVHGHIIVLVVSSNSIAIEIGFSIQSQPARDGNIDVKSTDF